MSRDASELGLYRAARERGLPVLGICRGLQIMAVAHGGSLVQNLPDVESKTGFDILDQNFGGQGTGQPGTIVFRAEQGVDPALMLGGQRSEGGAALAREPDPTTATDQIGPSSAAFGFQPANSLR